MFLRLFKQSPFMNVNIFLVDFNFPSVGNDRIKKRPKRDYKDVKSGVVTLRATAVSPLHLQTSCVKILSVHVGLEEWRHGGC